VGTPASGNIVCRKYQGSLHVVVNWVMESKQLGIAR
jgi:hypothetical protein